MYQEVHVYVLEIIWIIFFHKQIRANLYYLKLFACEMRMF